MVEAPNFEYKYDLAYRKSFAARLSFRIMGIAAAVFLVAVVLFFYFTGDSMTLPLTHQIVKYGTIVFIVGLTSLFVFCTWAIYQMTRTLFRNLAGNYQSAAHNAPALITADGACRLLDVNRQASAIEVIDYLKQHVNVFADGTVQGDDLTLLFLRHDAL